MTSDSGPSTLRRCEGVTPEVGALLALAMWPDPARISATLSAYASDPELQVWAWTTGDTPVCAAGLRVQGKRAEVLHLGTRPQERGQGHARRLVLALMDRLHLGRLEAETDDDSVGFYRQCGFTVTAGEPRGGRPRYRCTLTAGAVS